MPQREVLSGGAWNLPHYQGYAGQLDTLEEMDVYKGELLKLYAGRFVWRYVYGDRSMRVPGSPRTRQDIPYTSG